MRRWIAGMLAAAMSVTMFAGIAEVDAKAAAKPKLSKKKLELTEGTSKTLKVTKANGAKVTWKSSSKKVAAVKKAGKYACKVTAKKKGKAVVTCKGICPSALWLGCRSRIPRGIHCPCLPPHMPR